MGEIKHYKHRDLVAAEVVEDDGNVFTANGVTWAYKGDYLVHHPQFGVIHTPKGNFEVNFVPASEDESAAVEFTPDGKTVDQVIEFFGTHPDQVDRVKALEIAGGNRKGIVEY